MSRPIFHYSGRTSFNYKMEGKEILIGDYYHDAKEFKNEPWTAPEINTFKNKRLSTLNEGWRKKWLTRVSALIR